MAEQTTVPTSSLTAQSEPPLVLVVDDEYQVRALLRDRLRLEGYRCEVAASPDAALDGMEAETAQLVLLDVRMPGGSGVDLLHRMRQLYPDTAVMMVTVVGDIDVALESMRLGAEDYVVKPFNLDMLVHRVNRAMDKRRLELQLRDHQEYLEGKVQEQAKEIRQTFLGALQCLALAMEARDPYTAGHSRRVAELATAIGKQMGLGAEQVDELHWGSILHDIGKIAVDQSILDKPGRLTPAEYDHVMSHTTVGASLVGEIAPSKGVVEIIQYHHTPYRSGSGRGAVVDGHVSLVARIVAVADAYDAMTLARPYRPALSNEEAVKEIKLNMGRQFDPVVASTFVSMVNSGMPAKKLTVLVADDEASIRLLVRSALSGKYAVVEAADGDEAVRMARDYKPAVVVLDILMPQKDGLQACHEIKSEEMTREIPVVILTGVNRKLNRKLCTELGAVSYITKPFSPQRLLEIVDGIVGEGQR